MAKWIRENQPDTHHYHDLWHVCKGLTKKLVQASKESGNEAIQFWVKAIRSHLFWCAMSTKQGFGDLIVAKWKSIIRHIADKHDGHPDTLYEACAHGNLEEREWIKIGSTYRYILRCNIRKSLLLLHVYATSFHDLHL